MLIEGLVISICSKSVIENAHTLMSEQVDQMILINDHESIRLHQPAVQLAQVAEVEDIVGLAGRRQHVDEHPVVDDNAAADQRHQVGLDLVVELVLAEEAAQLHLVDIEERLGRGVGHGEDAELPEEAR